MISPRARWVERIAVLLLGLAVLTASQLPSLWGWRAQGRGYYPSVEWTGSLHTYADDATTYWSWMDQARQGRLSFTDRYTYEDHPRNYVNLLFWVLGSISRVTGLPVVAVYTAARPALGLVLFLLLYLLAARLFEGPAQRVVCFAFCCCRADGRGWPSCWAFRTCPAPSGGRRR